MLSIPKNLFYVIHRCGNLHKLAIWKLIFTAREVNGIQRSETLHALHWNWMMIMRNTDENTKIWIKHKYKYTLKPEGRLMGSRGLKPCMQCTRTRWEDDDCKKYKDTDKTRLQIHNETRGGVNW